MLEPAIDFAIKSVKNCAGFVELCSKRIFGKYHNSLGINLLAFVFVVLSILATWFMLSTFLSIATSW